MPTTSPYASRYADTPKTQMPKQRKGREQAEQGAGLLRMLGQAAPLVGTAAGGLIGAGLGGPAGAMLGSGIGSALGGAAGGLATGGAAEMERPYAEDDAEREARRRLTMSILSQMRS